MDASVPYTHKTFIRATEIWVPSRDRRTLEHGGGLYGELGEFGRISAETQFAYGEGLPGRAWAQRQPLVLKKFEPATFKRTEAAHAHGLTCGIALPIFAGELLTAVLVFFCGDDEEHVGAVEVWRNDPAMSYDLSLVDGYYGTADLFRWISEHTLFRPGSGLPGKVWQRGMPVLMNDLGQSYRFLRQDDARRVGISKGFGIPCAPVDGVTYLLTFLSARGTPIARRVEVWVPDATRTGLVYESGLCDMRGNLDEDLAALRIARGEGAIGGVWQTGIPALVADLGTQTDPACKAAREVGLSSLVALPIWNGGQLKCAVAWYF